MFFTCPSVLGFCCCCFYHFCCSCRLCDVYMYRFSTWTHEFLNDKEAVWIWFFDFFFLQWMSKYFTNVTIIDRLCVSTLLSNITLECGACELTHSPFQLLLSPLGNQHFYPFNRIMYHRVRCANLSWLKPDHWFQRSQQCIFNYVVFYVVTMLLCFYHLVVKWCGP